MNRVRQLAAGALALLLLLTLCACRSVRLENGETFVIRRAAPSPAQGGAPEPTAATAPAVETPGTADAHFFVSRADPAVQELFWQVYRAVQNFETRIILPDGVTRAQVEAVDALLYADCPELIHFSHLSAYTFLQSAPDRIVEVTASYTMTAQERAQAQEELEAVLSRLEAETAGLSDYEKELYIHDELVRNCAYDTDSAHSGSAYGALVQGRARCQGYANAMTLALRRVGIPCIYLYGTATSDSGSESHAWNGVCIEGDWVLLDATWDDPVGAQAALSHAYFNLDDRLMGRSHSLSPDFPFALPAFSTMAWSYCARNGAYIGAEEDGRAALAALLTQALQRGDARLDAQFEETAQCLDAAENLQAILQVAAEAAGVYPAGSSYTVDEKANALEVFDIQYSTE